MKNQQQIVFVAASAAFLMAATGALANTATVNGITWTYTVSNGKVTLGTDQTWESGRCVSTTTAGAISIPSTLGGYPVTRIGKYAFYGCKSITSVIIPNGVTSIGQSAFPSCTALRSVTIPNSVTSIEWQAFSGCREREYPRAAELY